MSSWGNKIIRRPKPNSQVIPESIFKKNIGENTHGMLSILNKPVSVEEKKEIELKYGFDLVYYRKFNDDVRMLDDNQIYNHFIHICIPNSISFSDYDYIVNDNFEVDESSIKDTIKIYGHLHFRNIKSYSDLLEYRKQLKHYYIYNIYTVCKYYYDLDLNFYKSTYLNNDTSISYFNVYLHYHKNKQNLRNNKQLIVIYSPPYDIKCGGIVVMHNLCKIINDNFGNTHKAKLFMYNNIRYKNPFCNDFAMIDEINDKTIVIYPEIVSGNPLNAKNVIRWILLDLGIEMPLTHYKNWEETDLVYNWETKTTNSKILCCPFQNKIFKNINLNTRTKSCYLIKKGRLFTNIKNMHPEDSICIDNLSLKEINDIFNESKYFYCYDPKTMYIIYAAICGCIPIIKDYNDLTEDEYFRSNILNFNNTLYTKGIVYKNDPIKIKNAEIVIKECEQYYSELFNIYTITVENFLNDITVFLQDSSLLGNTVKNVFG